MDNLQGSVSVDFESEVEDDIIPLFRRGEVTQATLSWRKLIPFFSYGKNVPLSIFALKQKSWFLWQDFNYGVEFMLLISFFKTASREATEDALASLQKLISQCSSFIVQATCGKTT